MRIWLTVLPLLMIALGIGSLTLSAVPDGGFLKGMFQGAGGALVVLGAYLFVLAIRSGRHDVEDGSMWRPSADAGHEQRD